MKRCWFASRCGFEGVSKRLRNNLMEASVCNDKSCDNDDRENKNTESASQQTGRVHCCNFQEMLKAIVGLLV